MDWRTIASHPAYEVSNTGLVRRGERVLKATIQRYAEMSLCANGIKSQHRVHRLVAEAFIPNSDNKEMIDHINRIKTDNRVENLRWVTRSENSVNTGVWGNNKLRHKNISNSKDGYKVQIWRNGEYVFNKAFKTLDEAIINRDIAGLFL